MSDTNRFSLPDTPPGPEVKSPAGKLSGLNRTGRYEQELKQAIAHEREALAKLDHLRHTFLGTVNHEMRTPLVLILQSIELLDSSRLGSMTPDQLDTLTVLKRQAQKLDSIVQSLIRVAGFLSKQETIKPVWGRLKPALKNVLPLAEFKARSKQITIKTSIPDNLPAFPIDVKQIEEVMTQLLDNAVKFNKIGGKILVEATADDRWVIISVTDTGVGIAPNRVESIWEVFEQESDPVRRAQEGLGLGLALVRYIVDAHNGQLELKTKPGAGSQFVVKLPLKPEP